MACEYSFEQKARMLAAGQYMFKAPPVPTCHWDMRAWVQYIDGHGKWCPNFKAVP